MKALYVQHVGILGGSSRSLYELLISFPVGTVEPFVVCPNGLFAEMLEEKGMSVKTCYGLTKFDNCAYSYYRGWRWLILLRELFLVFPSISVLLRARMAWGKFDVVHVNEITMPVIAILARIMFPEAAVFVHARAVQRKVRNFRLHVLTKIFSRFTDQVIAIDKTVGESLPVILPTAVIHNGLHLTGMEEARPSIEHRPFTVAMVGVLNRAKGCREFVLAAEICKARGYSIRFDFVGGAVRGAHGLKDRILTAAGLKEDLSDELNLMVDEKRLGDCVRFMPFTSDLESIYSNIDVVCFPSYLDAPGRPIFEAGMFGVPSIACISSPRDDTFIEGETGILIPPKDPVALADAVIELHNDPKLRATLGKGARCLAHSLFNASENARRIVQLYRNALKMP